MKTRKCLSSYAVFIQRGKMVPLCKRHRDFPRWSVWSISHTSGDSMGWRQMSKNDCLFPMSSHLHDSQDREVTGEQMKKRWHLYWMGFLRSSKRKETLSRGYNGSLEDTTMSARPWQTLYDSNNVECCFSCFSCSPGKSPRTEAT